MKIKYMAFIPALFLATTSLAAVPPLKINLDQITLSGLSSGGYMASQFHLAHGEWVSGVGIIAAGPYFCARGSIFTALAECVDKVENSIPLAAINQQVEAWRQQNLLAPSTAIVSDKVWIFHGTEDKKIHPKVSQSLVHQYEQWVSHGNIKFVKDKAFAHLFPTQENGNDCAVSKVPFIGNCQYDAATQMLNFITELPVVEGAAGELIEIDQQKLGGKPGSNLAEKGYLYVPQNCKNGQDCDLHVSFHGCNQNAEAVGDVYAKQTGINQWADSHNMVVLYPQTKKSTLMPLNPQACWDWWGYTNEHYATRLGPQIKAVKNIIKAIAGK